jgi:hypothetical protein
LADRFAGLTPAPGGQFAQDQWRQTGFGPVPEPGSGRAGCWAGCRLDGARRFGWAMLVEGTIAQVTLDAGDDPDPLTHYRGRYRALRQ